MWNIHMHVTFPKHLKEWHYLPGNLASGLTGLKWAFWGRSREKRYPCHPNSDPAPSHHLCQIHRQQLFFISRFNLSRLQGRAEKLPIALHFCLPPPSLGLHLQPDPSMLHHMTVDPGSCQCRPCVEGTKACLIAKLEGGECQGEPGEHASAFTSNHLSFSGLPPCRNLDYRLLAGSCPSSWFQQKLESPIDFILSVCCSVCIRRLGKYSGAGGLNGADDCWG